jgi:hypothetical protein
LTGHGCLRMLYGRSGELTARAFPCARSPISLPPAFVPFDSAPSVSKMRVYLTYSGAEAGNSRCFRQSYPPASVEAMIVAYRLVMPIPAAYEVRIHLLSIIILKHVPQNNTSRA